MKPTSLDSESTQPLTGKTNIVRIILHFELLLKAFKTYNYWSPYKKMDKRIDCVSDKIESRTAVAHPVQKILETHGNM